MAEELLSGELPDKAPTNKKPYRRATMVDARRLADMYSKRVSILKIAREQGVDPGTVGAWLRKQGVQIGQVQHFVDQPRIRFPEGLVSLLLTGAPKIAANLEKRIWGLRFSKAGLEQLQKFCRFVLLHNEGKGVNEIAQEIDVHRTTIAKWRGASDMPYLVRVLSDTYELPSENGWKLLPLRLESGGNNSKGWIQVPTRISSYADLQRVVGQTRPLEEAYVMAAKFGLTVEQVNRLRCDLFAYVLGFMLVDASKSRSGQERFQSLSLDLQLSRKWASNEITGEFVCFSVNSLGISMARIKDKSPTGFTKISRHPTAAFRWISERTPFFAWMFAVGLGLSTNQTTSVDPVGMHWIGRMPGPFRKRFVQGLADSDGSVKSYLVEISSLPNSDFTTRLLHGLGLKSAYTRIERGVPIRSVVRAREAAELPIFNEYVRGYRFQKLMRYKSSTNP